MANSFGEFAERLQQFQQDLTNVVKDRKARVVSDIYQRLLENTPVATGALRANWRLGINSADTEFDENITVPRQSTQVIYERAFAAATRSPLFLSNNAPYARFVNDGTDRIAPRNYLERSVIEAIF